MLFKIIYVNSEQLSNKQKCLELIIISWDRVLSYRIELVVFGSTLAQSGSRWDGYECVGPRKFNRGQLERK